MYTQMVLADWQQAGLPVLQLKTPLGSSTCETQASAVAHMLTILPAA